MTGQRPLNPWSRRLIYMLAVLLAGVLIGLLVGVWLRPWLRTDGGDARRESAHSVPVTALPGWEIQPAPAPDGAQVAFAWREHPVDDWDIFVQPMPALPAAAPMPARPATGLLPVSDAPGDELLPRWSPAGRRIAYVSYGRRDGLQRRCVIMAVARGGGEPQRLGDCGGVLVQSMDWSPRGDFILLSVYASGEPAARWRWLALDSAGAVPRLPEIPADHSVEDVRYSRDGAWLAYTLSADALPAAEDSGEEIYVFHHQSGETRRISTDQQSIRGLDWSADGRAVIAVSNRGGSFQLWRFDVAGEQPPRLLPGTVGEPDNPAVSTDGRILYSALSDQADVMVWSRGGSSHR